MHLFFISRSCWLTMAEWPPHMCFRHFLQYPKLSQHPWRPWVSAGYYLTLALTLQNSIGFCCIFTRFLPVFTICVSNLKESTNFYLTGFNRTDKILSGSAHIQLLGRILQNLFFILFNDIQFLLDSIAFCRNLSEYTQFCPILQGP